jgi:predicted Zn-dependent peptidase
VKAKSPDRRVAGVGIGFPGATVTNTADAAPLAVLDTIISGYRYPTGWLHDALRGGDRSFVYEVHAIHRPGITPGEFFIYAGCQPEAATEVHGIITRQLDKARAGEFTQEELDRAKDIIATTELMERQTNSELAMQASLDELYGLGYDYRKTFLEQVKATTKQSVAAIAKKYFTKPTIAVVTPAPEQLNLGITPTRLDRDEAEPRQAGR